MIGFADTQCSFFDAHNLPRVCSRDKSDNTSRDHVIYIRRKVALTTISVAVFPPNVKGETSEAQQAQVQPKKCRGTSLVQPRGVGTGAGGGAHAPPMLGGGGGIRVSFGPPPGA